jgi:hypothetical protein
MDTTNLANRANPPALDARLHVDRPHSAASDLVSGILFSFLISSRNLDLNHQTSSVWNVPDGMVKKDDFGSIAKISCSPIRNGFVAFVT